MRWDKFLYRKNLFNYLLYPLSLIFSLILISRRKLYTTGLISSYTITLKTISVGNIVAGGSGKTPFTIYLAKLLAERGYKVAVSHRGYKGKFEQTNRLISDREQIKDDARDAGDEAQLLAQKLPGIPVIAGKDRERSLKILQQEFPDLDLVILDDSFQHLRVNKDFHFLLFNSQTKLGNGFVLPAGILREPLRAIRFADCLIYNGSDEIPRKLYKSCKRIIRVNYRISGITSPKGEGFSPASLKNNRLALVSGIGQPGSFEETITAAGIRFEKHFNFPDHYDYKDHKIIEDLSREVKDKYDYLLTTEKDYTKLANFRDKLPLLIIRIEVHVPEQEEILILLREKL